MEDYYEYLDGNGVTTLYKLIKDDTVALIDSYSVTINGITTTLDTHINDSDIHTPISDIESMVDTKIAALVDSAPETLDTLKELSDALGNDPNFATTIANQIGNKADSVHTHVVGDITDFPTIPTKLSQLENDMGFGTGGGITSISWTNITDKPNFSTVATSGSYNDLSDTPTIPTVNNATLTIQKNSSNVATFTANASSDVIANITVPTKVSELTNDSGFVIDSDMVHKTGDETIAGVKTFSSKIVGNLQGNADTATSADNGVDSYGGSWIRFKNGIQMCWGSIRHDQRANFPNAFTSTPRFFFGYNTGNADTTMISGQARNASSTGFNMLVWSTTQHDWFTDRNVDWFAIGTW